MKLPLLILLIAGTAACDNESRDLVWYALQNGSLRLEIPAPPGVRETYKSYPDVEDYQLRGTGGFDLQIFAFDQKGETLEKEMDRQLAIVTMEARFHSVVRKFENGFVYRRKSKDQMEEFDFRVIRYVDDNELIFQTDQTIRHSREETERMVSAAMMTKPL